MIKMGPSDLNIKEAMSGVTEPNRAQRYNCTVAWVPKGSSQVNIQVALPSCLQLISFLDSQDQHILFSDTFWIWAGEVRLALRLGSTSESDSAMRRKVSYTHGGWQPGQRKQGPEANLANPNYRRNTAKV